MSTDTGAPLNLPYLDSGQAQPEVKINDAWNLINAFAADHGGSDTGSDSGGGSISVSDGTTTVDDVTSLIFTHGTVADEGGGVAHYTPPTGGGGSGGGGSGILPLVFGDVNLVTPDDSGFTLDVIGSGTLASSVGDSGEIILTGSVSSGGFAAYRKAYANIDFDIKMFLADGMDAPWAFYIRDSSTGNILTIGSTTSDNSTLGGLDFTSTAGAVVSVLGFHTTEGSWSAGSGPLTLAWPYGWYRLTRVGNLYTIYVSLDGSNWRSLGSVTSTWAATPDQFGFCFFTAGGDFRFWSLDGI